MNELPSKWDMVSCIAIDRDWDRLVSGSARWVCPQSSRESENTVYSAQNYTKTERKIWIRVLYSTTKTKAKRFQSNSKFTKSYTIIIFVNANSKITVIVRFREWSNPQQVEWCNLSADNASDAHSRKEKEKNGEKEKWYSMQSTK